MSTRVTAHCHSSKWRALPSHRSIWNTHSQTWAMPFTSVAFWHYPSVGKRRWIACWWKRAETARENKKLIEEIYSMDRRIIKDYLISGCLPTFACLLSPAVRAHTHTNTRQTPQTNSLDDMLTHRKTEGGNADFSIKITLKLMLWKFESCLPVTQRHIGQSHQYL